MIKGDMVRAEETCAFCRWHQGGTSELLSVRGEARAKGGTMCKEESSCVALHCCQGAFGKGALIRGRAVTSSEAC